MHTAGNEEKKRLDADPLKPHQDAPIEISTRNQFETKNGSDLFIYAKNLIYFQADYLMQGGKDG